MKKLIGSLTIAAGLSACSSSGPSKVVLDKSGNTPSWVEGSKVSWEDGDTVNFKSKFIVKGNERVNGCMDLAKLDSRETLVSEIQSDIKGTIDSSQQSISEDAELLLGKSRSSEFSGRIQGLQFPEQYYERYQIGEREEISCWVLGKIKKSDYNKVKNLVVNQIQEIDPALRTAIRDKHVDFFRKPSSAN